MLQCWEATLQTRIWTEITRVCAISLNHSINFILRPPSSIVSWLSSPDPTLSHEKQSGEPSQILGLVTLLWQCHLASLVPSFPLDILHQTHQNRSTKFFTIVREVLLTPILQFLTIFREWSQEIWLVHQTVYRWETHACGLGMRLTIQDSFCHAL